MKRYNIEKCSCGGEAVARTCSPLYLFKNKGYRVVCSSCRKLGLKALTPRMAIMLWNFNHRK